MATLSQEMKDMVRKELCFVGTASANGTPNVAPKRSTRVLNDNTLIYTETTGGTSYNNIKNGSKVSVAVVNRKTVTGFKFNGRAEIQHSGEHFEMSGAELAVVIIHIEEIQDLRPGDTAGKKIS